ncbi:MAG: hypothetical protein LBH91_05520 [Prevotellaceae bacterium]|jgi:hypothetical protein|nr:hypothetical protein [Prevotellaceae bacterium]
MKTFSSFIVAICLFALPATAQLPAAVTDPDIPITWLGLDFEEALIIGDASLDMPSFTGIYAKKINDMIENQPKRYDFEKYLKKKTVHYETDALNESNAIIFTDNFVPSAPNLKSFTMEEIADLVADYSLKDDTGIGVVLIVRSMDRIKRRLTANLTYIDMDSRTVLYTKEFTASGGGVEWAAYWANAVRRVLVEMQKSIKN